MVLSTNFTNGTLIAVEDATRMKSLFGSNTSVFTYQSQWVAAAFYPEVRFLMENPETFEGFFLKNADGTFQNYTGYCSQVGVSPDDYPTCIGYYWDWCNETGVDWYVNKVLRAMVADPRGIPYQFDGVFLDNSDGFHPRSPQCDAHNATINVHIQTGKMFQKYGKWPVFSMTSGGTAGAAEVEQVWAGGVGFSKFYEYFVPQVGSMVQLYNDTVLGLPTIVHAPNFVKRHPSIGLTDALAAFLVAAGGASHSYFQYSSTDWTSDKGWPWSPFYDAQYGAAMGPPIITTYGPNQTGVVWERKFSSGAVATVNCTPPSEQTRFEWCHGNISVQTML
eukprot:m.207088 g.207088  ORF g.207088 m.207088 type:complete len:334 (+) comp18915_c0_seq1:382-1383(+)